ncbi:hypothetical protein KIW84_042890 [Lathyrus oleraceus]|uniref:ATP-dependent DNA helicase n=2 Tax=Pisum sativum TaxID=3888 RepID=A0A9D4XFR7_PEA|nr:hypothetical protein KIW84_042890 [Pisum sativum]
MTQRYEDGMTIVLNGGKPDIFLSMTCNPSWSEITSKLLPFQTPQDRPDLLKRIFRSMFEKLKDDVINKGVLEICSSIKSIKYLYKYVYKGPDRVAMEVHKGSYMDEVQQYVDARWICPTSWEYLLINNGMTFSTFKKSAEDRGFLETDHKAFGMSFFTHMVEDYKTANNVVESNLTNMLLKDLNELLNLHGKKIEDYDLPSLPSNTIDRGAIPSIIQEELAIDIPNEDIESVAKLNNDQMIAFNTIMNVIVQKHSGVFFVDGPGGTGKTFLYRTLMAILRSKGEIVLATASSGIAATLLPGGRTAHSQFKIPIDIQPSSICGIQKQKDLENLIRVVAAIIWDETPLTNKNCLEALDRSLQDICSNNAPFSGKVLIMGRGFLSSSSCCKKRY